MTAPTNEVGISITRIYLAAAELEYALKAFDELGLGLLAPDRQVQQLRPGRAGQLVDGVMTARARLRHVLELGAAAPAEQPEFPSSGARIDHQADEADDELAGGTAISSPPGDRWPPA